jgi:SAM-dependent methyltransferase
MTHHHPELTELKERLRDTWTAGDYGRIARGLQQSAEDFLGGVPVGKGDALLDIACGTGQVAIPAARAGARVTGLDLAEQWIAQARERAAAEGLDVQFDVGDAEALPYGDDEFDIVISLIGVMFAPRPDVATAEMLRVCRPGGRIVLGNWTPEGFVGRFFKTVGTHVPPPDMASPLLWGDEDTVRERLGPHVRDLRIIRRHIHFDYPMPPAAVVSHYVEHFGPVRNAHRTLDADGRKALESDLEALWSEHNQADDGSTQVDGEILEIVALR